MICAPSPATSVRSWPTGWRWPRPTDPPMRLIPMRLACLLAALLGLTGFTTPLHAEPPIHALDWLAQEADPVAAVTKAPPECLAVPVDGAAARQVEAGRLLFRSPLLLGGQAARHGLTCQTCHVNGHDNPQFF